MLNGGVLNKMYDFCTWEENEEGWYAAKCENENESDFWLSWFLLRNFDYCPYCGKRIKFIHQDY